MALVMILRRFADKDMQAVEAWKLEEDGKEKP